mmetsp:Transcript_13548/g.32775  ORF Transcript_13548/g.32775 Transcript_13548/m.32775 type:complete len:960 (+) Transcript_13548:58-2937(+)
MEDVTGRRSPSPSVGSDWETVAPLKQVQTHHLPDQDSSDSDGDWHINGTSDTESSDSIPPFEAFRRSGDPAHLHSPALSQSGSAGARGTDTEDSEDSETEESEVSEETEGGSQDCGVDADYREEGCPCGAAKAFGPTCLCFGAVDPAGEENPMDEDQDSNSLQCCCCGLAFEDVWIKLVQVLDSIQTLVINSVTKCKQQCKATSLGLREIVIVCLVVALAQIVVVDRSATQIQLNIVTNSQEEINLATQRLWDLLASQDSLNSMKHNRVDDRLDQMQEQLNSVRNLTSTNGDILSTATQGLSTFLASQDTVRVQDDTRRDAQLEYLQERSAREEVQVALLHRQVAVLTTEVERLKQEGLEAAQQAQQALYQAHLLQADLRRQQKEGKRLREQSRRLRAEGDTLRKHSRRLLRQSKKLRRECKTLRRQGKTMRRELATRFAPADCAAVAAPAPVRPLATDFAVRPLFHSRRPFERSSEGAKGPSLFASPNTTGDHFPLANRRLSTLLHTEDFALMDDPWPVLFDGFGGFDFDDLLLPSALLGYGLADGVEAPHDGEVALGLMSDWPLVRNVALKMDTDLGGYRSVMQRHMPMMDDFDDVDPFAPDLENDSVGATVACSWNGTNVLTCRSMELATVAVASQDRCKPGHLCAVDISAAFAKTKSYHLRRFLGQQGVGVFQLACPTPTGSSTSGGFGLASPRSHLETIELNEVCENGLWTGRFSTRGFAKLYERCIGFCCSTFECPARPCAKSCIFVGEWKLVRKWGTDTMGSLGSDAYARVVSEESTLPEHGSERVVGIEEEKPGQEWWRFHGMPSRRRSRRRIRGDDVLTDADARNARGGYRVREQEQTWSRRQARGAGTRGEQDRRHGSKGAKVEGRRAKPTKGQQNKSDHQRQRQYQNKWWKKSGDGRRRRRQHGEFRCGQQENDSCFWWEMNSRDWLREGDVWLQSAVDLGRRLGFGF